MPDVELLEGSEAGATAWRDALDRFPRKDVYYTPEYVRLCADHEEGRAAAFLLRSGSDAVLHPVVVRSLGRLPWAAALPGFEDCLDLATPYGYAGPLCSVDDPARRAALLAQFDRGLRPLCRRMKVVSEFIRFHPLLRTHEGFGGEGCRLVRRGETIWLPLSPDEEELLSRLTPAARNKVRRARREGVVVEEVGRAEGLDLLVRLYRDTMNRVEAPAAYDFPETYFESLASLPHGGAQIAVARHGGAAVWAGIFLREGEFLHYHLSGSRGSDGTPGVNNLALFAVGLKAARTGATIFHLGGGFGARSDSLFAFKASMSRERADFFTGERIHDAAAYARLCEARGAVLSSGAEERDYFPAYRA